MRCFPRSRAPLRCQANRPPISYRRWPRPGAAIAGQQMTMCQRFVKWDRRLVALGISCAWRTCRDCRRGAELRGVRHAVYFQRGQQQKETLMLRQSLMTVALLSGVGCPASTQLGPIGPSRSEETAQLAAYAATASLPDNANVRAALHVP